MKKVRIILYVLLLASLFFVPLQRIEIANMEPVQAVWLYQEDGNVVLETDTEDKGIGTTVEEALTDMKENSPGIIYLDTAEFLFVSTSAQKQIPSVQAYLKETVRLCQWNGQGSISEAVKYADAHKIGLKMKKWGPGSNLPELPSL